VDNQQALKLLHRYHDATNTRRLDELDEIFAKDFINFAAGFEPVKSLAAMKTLIAELLLAFPDWHVTIEDMFAQDNKVVTREGNKRSSRKPSTHCRLDIRLRRNQFQPQQGGHCRRNCQRECVLHGDISRKFCFRHI